MSQPPVSDTTWLIEAEAIQPQSVDHKQALAPLSCRIASTGITCLLGEQSDIVDCYLRALAGLQPIMGGELQLLGQPVRQITAQQWPGLRIRLGYILRGMPLLSVLNGLENVILPALYHGLKTRQQATEQATQLLQQLACDAELQQLPAHLSPLQRYQLAIARTIILSPDVLLIDEPYHALQRYEFAAIDHFLAHWGQQHALIVATENLHFVKHHANNILYIGNNNVLCFASWQSLCQSNNSEVQDYLQRYHQHFDI